MLQGRKSHSTPDTPLHSQFRIAVGLLNALYAFKGYRASPKKLAEEACEIEIDKLGEPIGKQDQYIAARGDLQHIKFNADETVALNTHDRAIHHYRITAALSTRDSVLPDIGDQFRVGPLMGASGL